ncbi:unnamed protein product, partial [Ectocarpus sp. 12 AP-2014]
VLDWFLTWLGPGLVLLGVDLQQWVAVGWSTVHGKRFPCRSVWARLPTRGASRTCVPLGVFTVRIDRAKNNRRTCVFSIFGIDRANRLTCTCVHVSNFSTFALNL